MTIKKWETPQIINLGVEETETPSTLDEPHAYHCPVHGAVTGIIIPDNGSNDRFCPISGCGRKLIWVGDGEHPPIIGS